jgi:hypothetical protein
MNKDIATLTALQRRITNTLYRCVPGSARAGRVRLMYARIVRKLELIHGQDAHCCLVDYDLANTYSDWHKELTGHRPTAHVTRATVQAWIIRHSSPEAVAERLKLWDAEERVLSEIF